MASYSGAECHIPPSLPHAPLSKRSLDATDLLLPYSKEMDQLLGYMDAAHGK
jgi:hypothetical protein